MNIIKTHIEGVCIIEPRLFSDDRGYFYESFSQRQFEDNVCRVKFVQDNQSLSNRGVIRGLHFQAPPFAQSKLVRVVQGAVLDIAVDIRVGSSTFGQYVAVELTAENHRQLFIPHGFAHGFAVLSDNTIFQYKCDNYYTAQSEGSLLWNDPVIGIKWGIDESEAILSDKDRQSPTLNELTSPFNINDTIPWAKQF